MQTTNAPEAVFKAFVTAINARSPGNILSFCTPDHRFIDSLGNEMTGLEMLLQGWGFYFSLFPDYCIEVESLMSQGGSVLACGFASATHAKTGRTWRIPAAWRARTDGKMIAEWQVYADNKPVYELLAG